jgi:hypothetical protein
MFEVLSHVVQTAHQVFAMPKRKGNGDDDEDSDVVGVP